MNSSFFNPNLQHKIGKTVNNILKGKQTNQNQKILVQLRKAQEYPMMICHLLSDLCQQSSMIRNNTDIQHLKIFYMLQITKMNILLTRQQCWWILKFLFYSDNDKIAKMIRQLCIFYKKVQISNNTYHLKIILNLDIQKIGLIGIIRYLQLVYELIKSQYKQIQNNFIRRYGQCIVAKLYQLLQLQVQESFVVEFALVILTLINGFDVQKKYWTNIQNWKQLLAELNTKIKEKKDFNNSGLNKNSFRHENQYIANHFLCFLLSSQISTGSTNNFLQFYSQGENYTQIIDMVIYCLKKVQGVNFDLHPEKQIYLNCLEIVNSLICRLLISERINYTAQYKLAENVILVYSQYCRSNSEHNINELTEEEDFQEQRNEQNMRKYSVLKTILQKSNPQILQQISQNNNLFTIKMMQFSLSISPSNQRQSYVTQQQFQKCLDYLNQTLLNEPDTYLFIKQKSDFIWVILKYIHRFRKQFNKQLTLKICYIIDALAYKCDTIANQAYCLLQVLVQQILDIESYNLINFLQTSITHINQNQWVLTHTCYFHIIKIILNLNSTLIFNEGHYNDKNVNYFNNQNINYNKGLGKVFRILNPLQNQILIMIKNMIQILKKQMNYQSIHKLNDLLQYLRLNCCYNIYQSLKFEEINTLIVLNYNYQIFTQASADIYLYFCQFSQSQRSFVQSLDLYQFWQSCQSQKLDYYTSIYLKFIDSQQKYFCSSQQQSKLCNLKKNLWHRFVSENNIEERQRIVKMFKKQNKYFYSLICQYEKIKCRNFAFQYSQNSKNNSYSEERIMELQ